MDFKGAVVNFDLPGDSSDPWRLSVTERARALALRLGDVLQEFSDLDETHRLSALMFVTVAYVDGTAKDWGTGDNELVEFIRFELQRQLHALDEQWQPIPTMSVPVGKQAVRSADNGESRPDSEC